MNKKLVCLTLSILMLLTCVFASCTPKTTDAAGEGEPVDNSAKTITMWVVTEDETTEEAQKLVNEAFTKITKAKFKTNVVIQFCTEDEYYEKLESAIETAQYEIELEARCAKELRQYLKANKTSGKDNATLTAEFYAAHPEYQKFQAVEDEDEENAEETEEETVVNDYGITEIKYPDVKENQVDIFYISGYDKYMEYYDKEYLASLGEELSTSSKKLKTYISTSLLDGVQIEGGVYAIPNNVPIGEYTYMMIDKTLFDAYYQKIDKVSTVLDLDTFLNDVSNYNGDKTADDEGYVVPLASTYEECIKMLCWYWDLSYVDQSVYETYYDAEKDRTYVLQEQYKVKIESTDAEGNATSKEETRKAPVVVADKLYKTNEAGQYVDANGNVLNYRYEIDAEAGLVIEQDKNGELFDANGKPNFVTKGSGDKAKIDYALGKGALYLVDENGDPVTPENDKRVILEDGVETNTDADGKVRPTYYYFYNTDCEFSVLGTMMKNPDMRSRGKINLGFNALFTNGEYHEMFATLKNYEYMEYYGEVKEGQSAAVSFVKGDARIKQAYEQNGVYVGEDGKEYYVVIAEKPEATEEELYGNMFAVYANSNYLSRAMKVITYLNTNTELRDLLQYGIEGQHYELVGEDNAKTVRLITNEQYGIYRMDQRKTGNCFIATPTEEQGADAWTYAKIQNNDSLINPLLGFDFNKATEDSDYSLDTALIDHIKELNEETLALIAECGSKEDLMALMTDTETGLVRKHAASAGDVKLNKATNSAYNPELPLGPDGGEEQTPDTSGSSPYTVYQTWLTSYGYAYKAPSATADKQ